MLGDPQVLLFDEPVNGLDPEGILWVRTLLRRLATEGRAIFVSSHLMSEMALTADHLVVIGRGRLIADCSVEEFRTRHSESTVRVRTRQSVELRRLLRADGAHVREEAGVLLITGASCADVGDLAARHHIPLHELVAVQASLEEVFMDVTRDSVDFRAELADTTAGAVA
jgi:ABC-2 type transport system ATP-binding protein